MQNFDSKTYLSTIAEATHQISRQAQDAQTRIDYLTRHEKTYIELHSRREHKAELAKAKARLQAYDDCLDAMSGANKRV